MARRFVTKEELKETLKVGLLGDDSSKNENLQDEGHVKVTVLLPKDTIDTIDRLVKSAKVGSRGRLIQLLVDDVASLKPEYETLDKHMNSWKEEPNPQQSIMTVIAVANILRRLDRYYDEPVIDNSNSVKGKTKEDVHEHE